MSSQSADPIEQTENQLSDLTYDFAWRSVDRATAYLVRTDAKVSTLAGITGVMLTVLLTIAPSCFPKVELHAGLLGLAQALFLLATAALIAALTFCLCALLTRKTVECKTHELIKVQLEVPQGSVSARERRQQLAATLAGVEQTYYTAGESKHVMIRAAYISLFVFLAAVTLTGIVLAGHMIF
jgi:apolipoprotein N-acyltransferase